MVVYLSLCTGICLLLGLQWTYKKLQIVGALFGWVFLAVLLAAKEEGWVWDGFVERLCAGVIHAFIVIAWQRRQDSKAAKGAEGEALHREYSKQ